MMALLTLLAIVLMGVVAVGMVFAILGLALSITFGLVGLLFKLLPLLLIGWVVVKLIGRSGCHRRRISAADQRWLDGE